MFDQVVAVDPAANAAMVDGAPLRNAFSHNAYVERIGWNGACCPVIRRGSIAHVEDIVEGYAANSEDLRRAGRVRTIRFD